MLTLFGVMIFSIRVCRSRVKGLLGWSWHSWVTMMMLCEHVVEDWHLYCNQLQPHSAATSISYNRKQLQQQSATIAGSSCIRQLAIKRPVLTGSNFEIVNSIVWKLSLILTKTVPNRKPTEGFLRSNRSTSTIRWVAGDHSTTVDR